jgi:hypothetical protein
MHDNLQRWPLPLEVGQKVLSRGTPRAPLPHEHLKVGH